MSVDRYGLWTALQESAAREALARIDRDGLEVVRFAFADQHGIVRGKTLVATEAKAVWRKGIRMVSTILLKDSSNRTAWPVFTEGAGFGNRDFQGANDILLVPDPTTFRVLPWTERTGWVLCDSYFPDGRPVPFDSRGVMRRALGRLEDAGFDFLAGLEVEFHVFRLENARLGLDDSGWPGEPPEVSLTTTGYQLLAEQRQDQMEPVLAVLRRHALALGMPLTSVEIELGPSQCEFVFGPANGLDPADTMILFRNTAKQVLRRMGYHASFMCRPRIPNVMSSGWHLHQSLRHRATSTNAFIPAAAVGVPPTDIRAWLSPAGAHYTAGLLVHAGASTAFAAPTINGYRRYRPNSLAPDRATWGSDNRGAMIRVIGGPGDAASRVENRVGEPAANPYLYMASQIFAGLDGIARGLDPGPSADAPYDAPAPRLPATLADALDALRGSACLREGFGDEFIEYYLRIKHAELARFNAEVSEWEQREYFDLF